MNLSFIIFAIIVILLIIQEFIYYINWKSNQGELFHNSSDDATELLEKTISSGKISVSSFAIRFIIYQLEIPLIANLLIAY